MNEIAMPYLQDKVNERVVDMVINKEARRQFNAMESTPLPPVLTGEEFYDLDFPKQDWLFEGLVERGQRVILSGYWKSGKTTAFGYALKAICDGGPYMGVFDADAAGPCPALYLNLEVPDRTMYNYLFSTIGIKNRDKLLVHNLLGYNVNILNDVYLEQLQELVSEKGICALFVDPLRQFYSGDENDNSLAKEVTDKLDILLQESDSLQNIFLVAHTGHANGLNADESGFARPRGASKWADWADVLLSLTRHGDDRFFAARGRNGEIGERRLRLMDEGLWLDLEVNPREARAESIAEDVIALLQAGPRNMTTIKAEVQGEDRRIIAAVNSLVEEGILTRSQNPNDRRATLIAIANG